MRTLQRREQLFGAPRECTLDSALKADARTGKERYLERVLGYLLLSAELYRNAIFIVLGVYFISFYFFIH